MKLKLPCLLLFVVAALAGAGSVHGAWSPPAAGTGAVGSKTMPAAGGVPSGSVASHNVTVTWTASQFASGNNVPGYMVKRYDAVTNALQTVLPACSGVVAATSCTETGVPTGSWKYTVTPAAGNWRGAESGKSAIVVVLV